MKQFMATAQRQSYLDRDTLWRDYRSAFTLPRSGKDLVGAYRPTYGMAE